MGSGVGGGAFSGCSDLLWGGVSWSDPWVVTSFVVLGTIDVMVVVGNTLVILAVFLSPKLRSATANLFVASLAVADLLVGLAVLPFSTAYEVTGTWAFGSVWCRTWLAVDVWMCTASILNLCAISLDRYVAVTRPVSYPSVVSPRRAKVLVAVVWCASFVICLPPLVGWREPTGATSTPPPASSPPPTASSSSSSSHSVTQHSRMAAAAAAGRKILSVDFDDSFFLAFNFSGIEDDDYEDRGAGGSHPFRSRASDAMLLFEEPTNASGAIDYYDDVDDGLGGINANGSWLANASSSSSSTPSLSTPATALTWQCTCALTSDKGYRIYSALGSFYLPMLVMVFFYWKIYRAAVETTRAINRGFLTTKASYCSASGVSSTTTTTTFWIGGHRKKNRKQKKRNNHQQPGGASAFQEEHRLTLRIHRGRSSNDLCAEDVPKRPSRRMLRSSRSFGGAGGGDGVAPAGGSSGNGGGGGGHGSGSGSGVSGMTFPPSSDVIGDRKSVATTKRKARRHPWLVVRCDGSGTPKTVCSDVGAGDDATSAAIGVQSTDSKVTVEEEEALERERALLSRMGGSRGGAGSNRNIKAQVKRFRNETKAAKTLGIIVGGFILCWLPFFAVYLVEAFCEGEEGDAGGGGGGGCVPPSLFSVFFWLGYCNSALNPCVYALFSRDFRRAFRSILCRCVEGGRGEGGGGGGGGLWGRGLVKERLVNMFPPTLHLASFFENTAGDNSEDGSNSR